MSGLLSVVGLLGLLVALVGLVKGSVRSVGVTSRGQAATAVCAALVVMAAGGALAPEAEDVPEQAPQVAAPVDREAAASPEPGTPPTTAPASAATPLAAAPPPPPPPPPSEPAAAPAVPLLVLGAGGDGDSWRDSSGAEYRMGLINAPESSECGGSAATAYRKRALADGFRATVYATDDHGRRVAVVTTAAGANLNVAMARDGIADDRYLDRFRHENPELAAQLDTAFREARAARRGIWADCTPTSAAAPAPAAPQAPQPVAGGRCHPDYTPCIPVQGDGSGRGAANDLDCGDVGITVRLRAVGRDPYRLDGSDDDGLGCE